MSRALWITFLSLLFLAGGALQHIELISPTQTNIALLAIGGIIITKNLKLPKTLTFGYISLLAYILILSLINHSTTAGVLVYIYYASCSLFALALGAKLSRATNEKSSLEATKIFLAVQAAATTIQSIATGSYFNRNQEIDLISGTLFLNSDSTLVACATLLIIYVHHRKAPLLLKLTCLLMGLVIALNCHSKAGLATYLLVASTLLASQVVKREIRAALYLTATLSLISISLSLYEEIVLGYISASNELIDQYNKTEPNERAGRLAPVGHLLSGDIKTFGEGYLTYYNPITKEWLYDSGFGTFYALSIDAGIITSVIYSLIFLYFMNKNLRNINGALISLVFFSYSFFNFSLSDMAFMFVLGFVSTQLSSRKHSRHKVTRLHLEYRENERAQAKTAPFVEPRQMNQLLKPGTWSRTGVKQRRGIQ